MSAMGMMLAAAAIHSSVFAIAGIAAYLMIRRWGPAAGSLAAGAGLVVMAIVAAVAMSPWPRWWTIGGIDRPKAAVVARSEEKAAAGSEDTASKEAASEPAARPQPAAVEATPSVWRIFLDELRKADVESPGWTWREWLAVGFLASLAIGMIRLGLGLRGVAWLRSRGRPVCEVEILDDLEILRAELGVVRPVLLTEAPEIATPATIGWRRPVVILPIDWRDWDAEERRAVLAHELAHVRRGDFAAGVVAQIALAMQFYHPLAHWLSARLRLEQELAADAWGARLSGGRSTYLAALARMALRLDGRSPAWPARAFLPSRDTFVRRIQMLKESRNLGQVALPRSARLVTVGAMAALGLIVAGLRGPIGEAPAMAQGQPVKADAVELHDMTYVPEGARMVVSIRPGSLLRRPEMKKLLDAFREGSFLEGFPIPPEEIEQLTFFWDPDSAVGADMGRPLAPMPSGAIYRATGPKDWKAILGKAGRPPLVEVRHAGRVYYRQGDPNQRSFATLIPDERTIVATEEAPMRDLISDLGGPAPKYPWDEAWKKVAPGQVMMAVDARWVRREVGRWRGRGAGLSPAGPETFSALYEKARAYAVSLSLSDRSLALDLVGQVDTPENGKAVGETLTATLVLGKNAIAGLRQVPGASAGPGAWLLGTGESLLKSAHVETSDGLVRMHAATDLDLAEVLRLFGPVLASARVTRQRSQSVNNLKQIGLAFHNYHAYHAANNHFPASANRDRGKFPYSWRVAILPYINEQELFNQYRFDEPWNSPNNSKLIDRMPAIYAYPTWSGGPSSRSQTSYFVLTGDSTIGGTEGGATIAEITDGTSNTILAVESSQQVPWTKPEDIQVAPKDPTSLLPDLGGFTPEGFNVLFADGSVHFLKKSVRPNVLKALMTRNGGEVVSSDAY